MGRIGLAGAGAALVYLWGLRILREALQGIFVTACYEYATTGTVPAGLAPVHITEPWSAPSGPRWAGE